MNRRRTFLMDFNIVIDWSFFFHFGNSGVFWTQGIDCNLFIHFKKDKIIISNFLNWIKTDSFDKNSKTWTVYKPSLTSAASVDSNQLGPLKHLIWRDHWSNNRHGPCRRYVTEVCQHYLSLKLFPSGREMVFKNNLFFFWTNLYFSGRINIEFIP